MPSTQIQAVLKYIKTFVSIVVLLLLSIVFDTCKEDDATPLTEQRQVAKRLSRTWTSAEVLFSPVSEHEASLKDLVLRFDIKRESEPPAFRRRERRIFSAQMAKADGRGNVLVRRRRYAC